MTRVAVIGVGAMGRNHARVYREIRDCELVGVADPDRAIAADVAALNATRAFDDYAAILNREHPEAVSVAVPTRYHHRVVIDALNAGCHVLIEKPIAAAPAEAEEMITVAARANRVLVVGHIERHNPAIQELKRRMEQGEVGRLFQIHTRRLGPFPPRVRDVGVIIDLATHDLDVIRYLTGSEGVRVYAETKREVHTTREDMLTGLVHFENDVLAVLEVNWLTPTKIRELTVTGERGMFKADYLTQDLYFYENAEVSGAPWDAFQVLRGVSEGPMTRLVVRKEEPLRAEIDSFLSAVHGRPAQVATGEDGLASLRLALALIESGETHQSINLAAPR